MKQRWWEHPICWLCDYGAVLLLIIALIVASMLTRNLWLPLFDGQNNVAETPLSPTQQSLPAVGATLSGNVLSGYSNSLSGYAFNFPAQWQGTELGTDIQFLTPQGAMAYVHVEPGVANIDSLISTTQPFSYDVLQQGETTISSQPSRCIETAAAGGTTLTAISCYFLQNQTGYVISLTELDGLDKNALKELQSQFMDLLASFRFVTR